MVPFASSLGGPFGEAFPCIDGIKKKACVSIEDLNKFISNSDVQVTFMVPTMFKMRLSVSDSRYAI